MATFFPIKSRIWLLALLIVLGINIFGAIPLTDLPSISLGSLGSLLIHDLLLVFLLCIMVLKQFGARSRPGRLRLKYPLMAFLFLTLLEFGLSLVRGGDPHFLLQSVRPYAYYLSYFLVLSFIKDEAELKQFIAVIIVIAAITTGVAYYQAITGNLMISGAAKYLSTYGLYQSLNSGEVLLPCAFLILFSGIIGKTRNSKHFLSGLILLTWIGGSILVLVMRGLFISLFLAMVMVIFNKLRFTKALIVCVSLFVCTMGVYSMVRHFSGSEKLSEIFKNLTITATYHAENRTQLMSGRLQYFFENPSLFGYGFKGNIGYGGDRYDPTFVSYHNLIADLVARYGLSGFIVFGWLMFTVFKQGFRLLKILPDSWQKSLVLGLLAFNFQTLILGYSSNSYFFLPGIIIIAPSWAMLELIERSYKQKYLKTRNDNLRGGII